MKKKLRKFVLFSASTTFVLYMLNKFMIYVSTIKNLLTVKNGSYYKWRFGNIYYEKTGFGKPLLLVHDLKVGSSSQEWKSVADTLSEKYTVYSIDLLGCGRSEKPNITFTNYIYVQLISDFIKNVIGQKTDVITSGSSGTFLIMACHNDSSLFHKLLMVNPEDLYVLNEIPSKKTKFLKFLIDLPILGTFCYNLFTSKKNIENEFYENYYFNPFKVDKEYLEQYYEAAHLNNCNSKYLFSSLISRFTNINILHALKSIDHSLYILAGSEKDHIHTIIDNYEYFNPAIETAFIPNTRHLPHLEMPQEFLDQAFIFLES